MTLIQLHAADGSPMTALGIMTLQLRITDFKFSHNVIICDRLTKTEPLFGTMYRTNSPCPMPGTVKRIATYKRRVNSLPTPETMDRRQILLL